MTRQSDKSWDYNSVMLYKYVILNFLKRLWLFVLRLWDQNLFSHIQNQLVESRDNWYLFLFIYLFIYSISEIC